MSTKEEKKVVDEENVETVLNAEAAENTESAEATEPREEIQEEPLSEVDELKKQLAEAMEKNAELQDKYLRQAAEFDNYRKRTIKEKAELIKSAAEKLMVAELPIVDDMDRALENMEKGMDADLASRDSSSSCISSRIYSHRTDWKKSRLTVRSSIPTTTRL